MTDNPLIRICIVKSENKFTFKIKPGYFLKLSTLETVKLLESAKNKINIDINGKYMPHLEINEVLLVHCNIVNNDYQKGFKILVHSCSQGIIKALVDTSPKKSIFLETFNRDFSYIDVWFIDQNFKLLDIKDKIDITLVIN